MTATGQRRCTGDRLLIPQGQMHQCSGFTKACTRLRPARATLRQLVRNYLDAERAESDIPGSSHSLPARPLAHEIPPNYRKAHHRPGELLRYFDQQLQSGEQRTC